MTTPTTPTATSETAMPEIRRSLYGEILNPPEFVLALLREAERAGCWETGIASDRKCRGTAINTAVYGFDGPQHLAIVQVRESRFHPRRHTRVRKDYYLLGRVESGEVFAHPIDSPIKSKLAMGDPQYCVDYALSKIWGCKMDELKDIIRQGDVAMIPVRALPKTVVGCNGESQLVRDTHKVEGDVWRDVDGTLYCRRGTKVIHTKGEHKTVKARAGFYRIQPGYRAAVWGFSAPTAD